MSCKGTGIDVFFDHILHTRLSSLSSYSPPAFVVKLNLHSHDIKADLICSLSLKIGDKECETHGDL